MRYFLILFRIYENTKIYLACRVNTTIKYGCFFGFLILVNKIIYTQTKKTQVIHVNPAPTLSSCIFRSLGLITIYTFSKYQYAHTFSEQFPENAIFHESAH